MNQGGAAEFLELSSLTESSYSARDFYFVQKSDVRRANRRRLESSAFRRRLLLERHRADARSEKEREVRIRAAAHRTEAAEEV